MWGKKRERPVSAELTKASAAGKGGIMDQNTKPVTGKMNKIVHKHGTKRVLIVLLALLLVACVLAFYAYSSQKNQSQVKNIPTEKEVTSNYLKQLEGAPVAETAKPEEKAAYYKALTRLYGESKQYSKAVDTFKKREAITEAKVEYFEYINLAEYYYGLKDKTAALAALDSATTVLPVDNPETGYNKERTIEGINSLRERYSQ